MLLQVESSENGSRTVVKGSTALPPCSGWCNFFAILCTILKFAQVSAIFCHFCAQSWNWLGPPSPLYAHTQTTISPSTGKTLTLSLFNLYIPFVTQCAIDLCFNNNPEKSVTYIVRLSPTPKTFTANQAVQKCGRCPWIVAKRTIMLR